MIGANLTGLKVQTGCCCSAVWPPTKAFPLCVLVLYGDHDICLIEQAPNPSLSNVLEINKSLGNYFPDFPLVRILNLTINHPTKMPKCFHSELTITEAGDSPGRSPSVSDRTFWVVAYIRFDCKLQSFGKSANRVTVTLKCKEITHGHPTRM